MVKKKSKEMQTQEHIVTLRAALFDDQGKDKDVTVGFAPFMKYNRNDLDLEIEFAVRPEAKLRKALFRISKENMEEVDEYWEASEKREELEYKANRFLIVRDKCNHGEIVAYCNFRFTMQGELLDEMAGRPSLFVYDLQVKGDRQRKGIGKHMMSLLQLVAKKTSMSYVSIMVPDDAEDMDNFIETKLKGFEQDMFQYATKSYDHYEELVAGLTIYQRCLDPSLMPKKAAAKVLAPVAEAAAAPPSEEAPKLAKAPAEATVSTASVAATTATDAVPATPEPVVAATAEPPKPNAAAVAEEDVPVAQRSLVF